MTDEVPDEDIILVIQKVRESAPAQRADLIWLVGNQVMRRGASTRRAYLDFLREVGHDVPDWLAADDDAPAAKVK